MTFCEFIIKRSLVAMRLNTLHVFIMYLYFLFYEVYEQVIYPFY